MYDRELFEREGLRELSREDTREEGRGEERDCANMFIMLLYLTQEQSLILVTKYFSQRYA